MFYPFSENASTLQEKLFLLIHLIQDPYKDVVDAINTVRSATKKYDIDRTTFTRYVHKFKPNPNDMKSLCPNLKLDKLLIPYLPCTDYTMFTDYIICSYKLHYELTRKKFCKLAYDYAVTNIKKYLLHGTPIR